MMISPKSTYQVGDIVESDDFDWLEELNNLDLQNELNSAEGVELEQVVKCRVASWKESPLAEEEPILEEDDDSEVGSER
ncbi:hypothetical protein L1987_22807 [Smallanthus sonchifolius]|uniref:Uncharacterized protein n=1 Tax=Smallanthus sonchifolius TaxID=185202 RepID=A0ACB9IF57_9ASTR|nr:hypothetical protein L1987_22807 [Smallanthus sonchifolius]